MVEPGTSSGQIAVTTGTQTVTGAGVLLYAELLGGTTANALTVYDGLSTSGLMLCNLQNITAVSLPASFAQGVAFNTGLYIVVSGTGSKGTVHYRRN